MLRDLDLSEYTDGRQYHANDMAKLGCRDCAGCSHCCRGMDDTILLDPYDLCLLCQGTGKTFEEMLDREIALRVVPRQDGGPGLILPHLRMQPETDACSFLNEEGRCTIHPHRPGYCRLFPLGRYFEGDDFVYILQVGECQVKERSKVKIRKWLDIPDLARYESFVRDWHRLRFDITDHLPLLTEDSLKQVQTWFIRVFYLQTYHPGAFYSEYALREEKARKALAPMGL